MQTCTYGAWSPRQVPTRALHFWDGGSMYILCICTVRNRNRSRSRGMSAFCIHLPLQKMQVKYVIDCVYLPLNFSTFVFVFLSSLKSWTSSAYRKSISGSSQRSNCFPSFFFFTFIVQSTGFPGYLHAKNKIPMMAGWHTSYLLNFSICVFWFFLLLQVLHIHPSSAVYPLWGTYYVMPESPSESR